MFRFLKNTRRKTFCIAIQWSPVINATVNKARRLLMPIFAGPEFPLYNQCKNPPLIKTTSPFNNATFLTSTERNQRQCRLFLPTFLSLKGNDNDYGL